MMCRRHPGSGWRLFFLLNNGYIFAIVLQICTKISFRTLFFPPLQPSQLAFGGGYFGFQAEEVQEYFFDFFLLQAGGFTQFKCPFRLDDGN